MTAARGGGDPVALLADLEALAGRRGVRLRYWRDLVQVRCRVGSTRIDVEGRSLPAALAKALWQAKKAAL